MDLFTIDDITWLPTGAPIRHYESLIWTDKFFEPSEMELETYAVSATLDKIGVGTLLAIRQSKEVVMVEGITISTDDRGVEKLKVIGKSLTSYLEHRSVGYSRAGKYQMARAYSNLDAGLLVLYNSFVNLDAFDLTTLQPSAYKSPYDRFVNCAITDSTRNLTSNTAAPRFIKPGPIESVVRQWFSEHPIGLRMLRPPNELVTKVSPILPGGALLKLPTRDSTKLLFDAFVGIDRSTEQTSVPPVVLDVSHNDLINPQYFVSSAKLKTDVQTLLDGKSILTSLPSDTGPPLGLRRRVLVLDGGAPEEGESQENFEADVALSATEILKSSANITGIDANVSAHSRVRFGVDYFLGDFVTVRGKFGISAKGRVTEFIRNESAEGEVSYPTLLF
jgi:hypothetical protein